MSVTVSKSLTEDLSTIKQGYHLEKCNVQCHTEWSILWTLSYKASGVINFSIIFCRWDNCGVNKFGSSLLFRHVCILWKVTISFVMSACLYVCLSIHMEQLGSNWMYFHRIWYLNIFEKSVKKVQIWLKSGQNDRYCTWRSVHMHTHTYIYCDI